MHTELLFYITFYLKEFLECVEREEILSRRTEPRWRHRRQRLPPVPSEDGGTSPRESETDPTQSHPGPSSSKRLKANSLAVHKEFVAYKFNDTNKERDGSRCKQNTVTFQ